MNDASLSTKLNRPYLPPLGSQQQIVGRVTVDPGVQTGSVERHIALVADTSGSMSGDKIQRVRDGAKFVLGYLDDDDILTIVGFDSSPTVVLEATRYGDIGRDGVVERIETLTAGGGTDIHGGLEQATEQLRELPKGDNTARRILLLSDGKDNRRGPEDFERQARDIDEHGIRIRAGGVGDKYNEETIRTLGTAARGQWSHIEEAGEIQEFFGEAVEEASTVVGANAELRMDIADGVEFTEVYRAIPQTQEIDVEYAGPNQVVVKLPDLLDRETQKVMMKIQAPGSEVERELVLADLTLEAGSKTAAGQLVVEYTDDGDLLGVENEDVSIELDETRIRTKLGEGEVGEAETRVEQMETKYGQEANVDELQDDVTRVKEGGRTEQEEITKVRSDDDQF